MAQNITLLGADYPDVPAVDLPKTGGGTARFVDALGVVTSVNGETGDVTITASDLNALKGNAGGLFYGTCPTAAGTAEKAVTCAEFTANDLKAGTIIVVSFSATNSGAVANLKLNVNGTGAKPIKYINNGTLGNLTSAGYLKTGVEYPFYYDGTNWVVWFNYNTTYSALSEADMETGTATAGRLITAARLKEAVEYHAPVTSVNGSTGDVTVTVPTKTSDLTNDSGFITSYTETDPVFTASVAHGITASDISTWNGKSDFSGSYNDLTNKPTIPTSTSDLINNGEGTSAFASMLDLQEYITETELVSPTFRATDATSKAVLQQAFGVDAEIRVPSSYTSQLLLLYDLEPRKWFCWMNGTEMEFARLSVSVNTSNSAITMHLRGRTSIATGVMGVDSTWTVTPLASDAEGVAY